MTETFDLFKLNTTTALCLDGTPASYYESRTGDSSRILIFLQGGAWCLGNDEQATLEDCYQRIQNNFRSTSNLKETLVQQDNILSKHPEN